MRSRCRPATPCTKSRRSATRTSRLRVREFTVILLFLFFLFFLFFPKKIFPTHHPSSPAGFLPPVPDHARAALRFSLALHEAASCVALDPDDPSQGHIRLRIGLHSGPIMSGIVGSLRCAPHRLSSTNPFILTFFAAQNSVLHLRRLGQRGCPGGGVGRGGRCADVTGDARPVAAAAFG